MKIPLVSERRRRAKLIFNPSAGAAKASPVEIVDVIHEMQTWKLVPEAYLVEPGTNLNEVVKDALAQGIRMFVVCGGDGTISVVAGLLAGTQATLGVIPIGTQNNTALSLGIPEDIRAAIAILRTGRRIKVDVGMVTHGTTRRPFLEVCSVGLISTLFPSADDIQHGNLARLGDFLSTWVSSPPAKIHLLLDDKREIQNMGHVVLVSNMPYIGAHYQVGTAASFRDGLLDVLFFADLSKMDLLNYIFNGIRVGTPEDSRIQHFHVRRVDIETRPAMEVMADGTPLGKGLVRIEVQHHALAVMVGRSKSGRLPGPGKITKSKQVMESPPDARTFKVWDRIVPWVSNHRPISRLAGLTIAVVIFITFLPAAMRIAFWNGLLSHKIVAGMAVVFGLLALSLIWSAGQQLDAWVFTFLNIRGPRPILLDRIMLGLTQIGSGVTVVLTAVVLFLAGVRMEAYELMAGALTLWLVVEVLKYVVHRSRPFIRLDKTRVVGNRALGRSFPSGHTSQAFFMAMLFIHQFQLGIGAAIALYAIAVMVGFTRMYVGAHYPRDVFGGAILGSIWGVLTTLTAPSLLGLQF